jgi:uncharacterized repeat protein (TIGR03803 family)
MRLPLLICLSAALLATDPAVAGERLLYSFSGGVDGAQPTGGVIADASGALYGVTASGGAAQLGTVFKLTPPAAGQTQWSERVLHAFQGLDRGDGDEPQTTLLMDNAGALYGTTFFGGTANNGTFFKLTPPAGGSAQWTESILYSFCPKLDACADGQMPVGMTSGRNGAFYGVTEFGGPFRGGAVVELTPPAPGKAAWTETVLVGLPHGSQPRAGVIMDAAGALYGTTSFGGAFNRGSVFKAMPPAEGKTGWTAETIWSFGQTPSDGHTPQAAVTIGPDGALYGTTTLGGSNNAGVVFRLVPPGPRQAAWHEAVLHRFTDLEGTNALAGVVFDSKGALYGTLAAGGPADQGSVFKLVRTAGSPTWHEQTLHAFRTKADAIEPVDRVLIRPSGAVIGTADQGGKFGQGAVYRIGP